MRIDELIELDLEEGWFDKNVLQFNESPGRLTLNYEGRPAHNVYRVVDKHQFNEITKSGIILPSGLYGSIRGTAVPERDMHPNGVVLKLKYNPRDDWRPKRMMDRVHASTWNSMPVSNIVDVYPASKVGTIGDMSPEEMYKRFHSR